MFGWCQRERSERVLACTGADEQGREEETRPRILLIVCYMVLDIEI